MVNFINAEEGLEWLATQGRKKDEDLDLFECALALAAQDHPGLGLDPYRQHMRKLCTDLEERHHELTNNMPSSLEKQIQSFQMIFSQKHGYDGDVVRYDNLDNADIIRVIDRRMGLPITLAILCIKMGQDVGWDVHGMNFPGHFMVRIDFAGNRAIIDPFQLCRSMQAPDLREMLKKIVDANAELSSNYYDAANNREILIRLHNNIKLRLIEAEEYQAALSSVERIKLIVPDEYRLDLDAGVLQARLEQPIAAISSLENYIDACPDEGDRAQAEGLIAQIRGQIN